LSSKPTDNDELDFTGGHVTALSVQKGSPDRFNVYVDERYVMGVRREVLIEHGLIRKGIAVTEAQLWAVWRDEQSYKARDLAARYLTARARSAQQVADYLTGKAFDEQVVEQTVEWLLQYGFLDDARYASHYVEQRLRARPRGKAMLRWELKQKGLSTSDIEAAFAEHLDDPDVEVEAALELLRKKAGRRLLQEEPLSYEEKGKLSQFLARKGFSGGVIGAALRRCHILDND